MVDAAAAAREGALKMYILLVFSGGETYYYGPFEDRPAAIAWAKVNCQGYRFEVTRLLAPERM